MNNLALLSDALMVVALIIVAIGFLLIACGLYMNRRR